MSDECGLAETAGDDAPLVTIATSAIYGEPVAYHTDVSGPSTCESEEQAAFLGEIEGGQTAVWVIRDSERGVIATSSRTP